MENLPQLDGNNDFFFCEVCSKVFSSKYSLQRHLKTVCQEEPALVAGEHSLFFQVMVARKEERSVQLVAMFFQGLMACKNIARRCTT